MAKYGKIVRIHLGTRPNVAVASPEGFEKILSSNRQITKVGKQNQKRRIGKQNERQNNLSL